MFVVLLASRSYSAYESEYSGGGDGTTEAKAKWIVTVSDLANLRNEINNGTEPGGLWYLLSKDIQLSTQFYWAPIGIIGNNFTGHFDGNNKTIYVRMTRIEENEAIVLDKSLFGYVRTPVTSGYAVRSLNISGKLDGYNTAGIAGHLVTGLIEGCNFSGELTSEAAEVDGIVYGPVAGGIVAVMGTRALGVDNCRIKDCKFNGNITATGEGENFARSGGIAGVIWGGNIEGCSVINDSIITAEGEGAMSGGIAGYLNTENFDDEISGCIVDGTVNSDYWSGGIIGYMHGGTLASNTINSDSEISATYSAGGIAGYIRANAKIDNNNVNSGAIIASETYSTGGIVGVVENGIVSDNISNSSIKGSVRYQGGIVGVIMTTTNEIAAIKEGNRYSGILAGIGLNEKLQPSNGPGGIILPITLPNYSIITSSALPRANEGKSYDTVIETNAGVPVTWSQNANGLPPGLSFSNGRISGIPKAAGTFNFTISGMAESSELSKEFTLIVVPQMVIRFSPDPVPVARVGVPYQTLTLSADPSPYTRVNWTISGNLPPGFSYSPNYPLSTTMQVFSSNPGDTGSSDCPVFFYSCSRRRRFNASKSGNYNFCRLCNFYYN